MPQQAGIRGSRDDEEEQPRQDERNTGTAARTAEPRADTGEEHCQQATHQRARRGDGPVDGRLFHQGADDAEVFLGVGAGRHGADFATQS